MGEDNKEGETKMNGSTSAEKYDKEKEVDEIKSSDPVVVDTMPVSGNGAAAAMANGKAENPMLADNKPEGGDGQGTKEGKEEEEKEIKQVGFFSMFRFADSLDILLLIVGSIAAMAHGAALPLVLVLFGEVIDAFIPGMPGEVSTTVAPIDPLQLIKDFSINYVWLGLAVLLVAFLQSAFWNLAAERQVRRIRIGYFRAILSQDIAWFDVKKSGELTTRISDDINKIHSGTGSKVSLAIQSLSTAVAGVTVGFIYSWKLSLVIVAVSFGVIIPVFGVSAYLVKKYTQGALDAYAKAGAVAEEAFSAMRTVTAFGGELKELARYTANLGAAQNLQIKKGTAEAFSLGAIFAIIYCSYAIAFWYGTTLIVNPDEDFSPGQILITFFAVLFGSFSIAQAGPSMTEFSAARGAAYAIWETIDNVPEIDAQSEKGAKPSQLEGKISFDDVCFVYPSRPESKVLQGLNLEVNVGETVALVGSSGCGKSTTVALIQRYYDALSGMVKIDGKDIKSFNVQWLREHIGVVSQEPVLFATTISENIRYGRLDVTEAEIMQAAEEANAHDFIMELPEKYNTLVGERGAQLSGGQKQRVAIARALVRNPRILLLDEATSALDSESESIVQSALEKAQHGRTTLVIAHRLSTIKNSDKICAMRDGVGVEQGSHSDLLNMPDGVYAGLVKQQQTKEISESDESGSESDEEEDKMVKEMTRQLSGGKIKRGDSRSSGRKSRGLASQMSVVSASSDKEEEDEDEEGLEEYFDMKRVLRMNSTEWHFMVIGVIAAAFNGAVQPAFAIIFSKVLAVYALPDPLEGIIPWCIFFAALGVVALVSVSIQGLMFSMSGEKLTRRLRHQMFKALMRQDMSYFDNHKNNTGALTTRLATEASLVQGVSGIRFGLTAEVVFNIVVAIIISFIYSWHLTLLVLAFVPLIGLAGVINWQLFQGGANAQRKDLEEAGKTVTEATENIRTVQSLTRELTFWGKYQALLAASQQKSYSSALIQGATFAFSQCIIYFAYAATFRLGGFLVFEKQGEKLPFENVFLVFSAIIFGAFGLGRAFAIAPDFAKAKKATARMFMLFDNEPAIDKYGEGGLKPEEVGSEVTFDKVRFRYPTRPDVPVLSGLSLTVQPGETLALVGSSGCGKSTTVALVERFYDSLSGELRVGAYDIRVLNLQWWRQQVGLVSQEPVLFDRSISENIAYGDNNRVVTQGEVEAAAKKANIHDFIAGLPLGYETNVGDKGTQLSGGQKQRIAIARALVRNPKILLLDEATSALDTESEKVVQAALDEAKRGRTCITIAHRLSTIHDANRIVVIKHGKVSESGTHEELMALKGQYHGLYTRQSLQH